MAILEVGLGGRLDAVNIYDADCAIVTGIALDHTDWLGPTREHIGGEKAGIFRTGKPAICADRQPPQALLQYAEAIGADLRLIGRDFDAGCLQPAGCGPTLRGMSRRSTSWHGQRSSVIFSSATRPRR